MKSKILILLVTVFTSCLYAAAPPSNLTDILAKYVNNPNRWSALNYAIEVNDFESAMVLVDYVKDFNRVDDGRSALVRAINQYLDKQRLPNELRLKLIKKLIQSGADLNQQVLVASCSVSNEEIFEEILSTGIQIDAFNGHVFTTAIDRSRVNIVRILISKGVDVNTRLHGHSPLSYAFRAAKLNYDIIESLLHAGADPNSFSCLDWALRNHPNQDNERIIQLLLKYGAKVT